MALVVVPESLTRLVRGLPRRVETSATTVAAVIAELETQWPGVRDRLCDGTPAIRRHLDIFVDGERASLTTEVGAKSEVVVLLNASGG